MKRIYFTSFLLISLISWFLSSNNLALADCEVTGKPNGATCNYETCTPIPECASEVCENSKCVQCASDDPNCQNG